MVYRCSDNKKDSGAQNNFQANTTLIPEIFIKQLKEISKKYNATLMNSI